MKLREIAEGIALLQEDLENQPLRVEDQEELKSAISFLRTTAMEEGYDVDLLHYFINQHRDNLAYEHQKQKEYQ